MTCYITTETNRSSPRGRKA